jgi:phage shock protein E
MLDVLKNLFSSESVTVDYAALKARGAQIVDVRSPEEFRGGHIEGAINLPVQTLDANLKRLHKDRPVITCCASGMRSASAKALLTRQGFEAVNGGPWASLARSWASA